MFRILLVTSLALLAFPAFAADINYNYVELGYQKIDIDDQGTGADADGDGFGVGGSFEVSENWFVAVSYSTAELDTDLGFSVDFDQINAGVGWHTPLANGSDFFARLDYVQAEASASGIGSADEDGFGFTIGVRGMVTDNIEIGGSIGYVDLGDAGDGTAFGANVLYNFTENFAAGLLLDFEEDTTSYGAGVRFYW